MNLVRRSSRRSFLAGASLAAAAALVAACSQPAPPTPAPAPPTQAPKPAEPAKPAEARPEGTRPAVPAAAQAPAKSEAPGNLVVWKFGGGAIELEYFPKWNDEFTKATGIKIDYSNNDWNVKREKMLAAFQAKKIADVLLADGQSLPDLAALGVVTAHDDIDKDLVNRWKPNYVPEIWSSTVYQGKFYGPAPYVDMGTFLTYNSKMLADAGFAKPPGTWEELREAAKKCTREGVAGITISASQNTNDANTFEGIAYANGGRWLDDAGKKVMIADPGFIDPLQLFVDLVRDKSTPQGVTETAFNQSGTLFFESKAAMWVSLSYPGVFHQSQKRPDDYPWGITLFPRQAKATGFTKPAATIITPTAAFFISSLSQRKEAAMKYADFWSRPDVQAGWDGSVIRGRVPALKANWETATFKKLYPDWYQLYKDGKMFDGSVPMPAFPGLAETEKALSTAMQQAILGQKPPKDALADAAKRAQTVVNEFDFK